jgi:hypothetical protein
MSFAWGTERANDQRRIKHEGTRRGEGAKENQPGSGFVAAFAEAENIPYLSCFAFPSIFLRILRVLRVQITLQEFPLPSPC